MRPWCTGRVYCNAPAQMKANCFFRGPPFWWLIVAGNVLDDDIGLTGTKILQPFTYELGSNGPVSWAWIREEADLLPTYRLRWEPTGPPGVWQMRLEVLWAGNPTEFQEWNNGPINTINDWRSLDGRIFNNKTAQSGSWTHGDPTFQMRVGEYSRMPAQSCRGDYNGPFP